MSDGCLMGIIYKYLNLFFLGAQSGGCRFDKKPGYRYSGCHGYDVSALNIVLGLHFRFRPELYSASQELQLFTEIGQDDDQTDSLNVSDSSTYFNFSP